jgi:hypothetical protein
LDSQAVAFEKKRARDQVQEGPDVQAGFADQGHGFRQTFDDGGDEEIAGELDHGGRQQSKPPPTPGVPAGWPWQRWP